MSPHESTDGFSKMDYEKVNHSSDPEWPDENYKLFEIQKRTILVIILPKIGRYATISAKFII